MTLAFETIESIIREHFDHITETDATTFTDCVNCLIAFTNSGVQDSVVSLNALAFLRFCALKLADGSLGNLERVPDSEEDVDGGSRRRRRDLRRRDRASVRRAPRRSRTRTCTSFYWFPLLAGLSELTFDPRPEIRRSALEVLFDTLKFHGENFSPGFWARVYDSILLPIFDHVRAGEKHAPEGDASPSNRDQPEADAWLYQTCQHCLELVVDLTAHFYPAVVSVPEVFRDSSRSSRTRRAAARGPRRVRHRRSQSSAAHRGASLRRTRVATRRRRPRRDDATHSSGSRRARRPRARRRGRRRGGVGRSRGGVVGVVARGA